PPPNARSQVRQPANQGSNRHNKYARKYSRQRHNKYPALYFRDGKLHQTSRPTTLTKPTLPSRTRTPLPRAKSPPIPQQPIRSPYSDSAPPGPSNCPHPRFPAQKRTTAPQKRVPIPPLGSHFPTNHQILGTRRSRQSLPPPPLYRSPGGMHRTQFV